MKIKKPFAEMDEDEYLFGKLTNDGGEIHWFFEEQNLPKGKKRRKIPEKRVDVDVSDLISEKINEEDDDGIIIEEYAVETRQNSEDNHDPTALHCQIKNIQAFFRRQWHNICSK